MCLNNFPRSPEGLLTGEPCVSTGKLCSATRVCGYVRLFADSGLSSRSDEKKEVQMESSGMYTAAVPQERGVKKSNLTNIQCAVPRMVISFWREAAGWGILAASKPSTVPHRKVSHLGLGGQNQRRSG